MLPQNQIHTFRNQAKYFALITMSASIVAGCNRPSVIPATQYRYIRANALIQLHPSWQQVIAIDREIAQISAVAPENISLKYHDIALPSPFTKTVALPSSLAELRQKQIAEDARRYVASVRESQKTLNNMLYMQEEKAEQKRNAVLLADQVAKEEAAVEAKRAIQIEELKSQLPPLFFREAVVLSRIKRYTSIGQKEPVAFRAEYDLIREQIDGLNSHLEFLNKKNMSNSAKLKEELAKPIAAQSKLNLDAFRVKLKSQEDRKVADATKNIISEPISAVNSLPEQPHVPGAPPLQSNVAAAPTSVIPKSNATLISTLGVQHLQWTKQRAIIVSQIRADTIKAIQSEAIKKGWVLVPESTPGAADGTKEMDLLLRDQWREADTH